MKVKNSQSIFLPIFREAEKDQVIEPRKQRLAYAPEGVFKNSTYRGCPVCYSKDVKRNGKNGYNGKCRYLCKSCNKSFTINIDAINIKQMFAEVYDSHYKDLPSMLNTKYRKERALSENKKIRQVFNQIVAEYNTDKELLCDEKDKLAFYQACELADRLDAREIEKYLDSWYYLLNRYNTDVTYYTEYYNWMLVRRYDKKLSHRQNISVPLLHCATCGSSDISTHGFNNNGRRRIKCNTCSNKSLIRVNNIVKESDAYTFFRKYLEQYTKDLEVINELTDKMVENFSFISITKHFDTLLAEQMIITHQTKNKILLASIGVQILMKSKTRGLYDTYVSIIGLDENLNLASQLKPEDAKLLTYLKPMDIYELENILPVSSKEEVTHDHTFYQLAAVIHEPNFYEWEEQLKESYDLARS